MNGVSPPLRYAHAALLPLLVACASQPLELAPAPLPDSAAAGEPLAAAATLAWSREIHGADGFGQGIAPYPLEGGHVLAFLHNGDSLNRLYHLAAADGATVHSFLVEAPGLGTGRITQSLGGRRQLGTEPVTDLDNWPFRFDVTDGTVRWLRRETAVAGYVTADARRLFTSTFADWDEAPAVRELDLATGQLVDSFAFAAYPPGRRGSVASLLADAPDEGGSRRVFFTDAYVTRDSISYTRSHLRAITWPGKELLWRRPFVEDQFPSGSTPVLVGDSLLVLTGWDSVYGFRAATGELAWSYWGWADRDLPIGSRHFLGAAPVLSDDGYLYVGSSAQDLFCLDAATGRAVWRVTDHGAGGALQLIGDGMLAVAGFSGQATLLYDRFTGTRLAELRKVTRRGWIYAGVYYDSATRRVYGYDGARAYCYRLNFEPPGE